MAPAPFFVAALLLLVSMVGPIIAVLATVPPLEVLRAFSSTSAVDAARVSLVASTTATLLATLLGVPTGYWLARIGARLRAVLVFFLALPLAFPPVASGIVLIYVLGARAPIGGWLSAHGLGVADTMLGVIAAEFFVSGAFVTIAATAAFSTIDSMYEEAARTLGASEWRIFLRVALPAAASNIAAGVAFAWLRAIGEYGATSIVAYHPTSLPVALYVTLAASGVRDALALSYGFIVLAAVVVGVQWVFRRRVVL